MDYPHGRHVLFLGIAAVILGVAVPVLFQERPRIVDDIAPVAVRVDWQAWKLPPTPSPTPLPKPAPPVPVAQVAQVAPVVGSGSAVAVGQHMATERGWIGIEWSALYQLWARESGWSTSARNRSTGACGIPQRHPCNGLSSRPAAEQIAWGLDYIAGRYGRPSKAWSHFLARNWY